jgi:hypothetical protein
MREIVAEEVPAGRVPEGEAAVRTGAIVSAGIPAMYVRRRGFVNDPLLVGVRVTVPGVVGVTVKV